jgi:GNAT superfamily N-acetyltransferase
MGSALVHEKERTVTAPDRLSIRLFRPADCVAACRLIAATIDACYTGVYPTRAIKFFKEFHSEKKLLQRCEEGDVLVAEAGGSLVATGTVVGNEILGVFVLREHQGRGCGKAIMLDLEERARQKGHTETVLSVSLPSQGFYERLGYRIIEAHSLDVGEGEYLNYWKARKVLA